MANSLKLTTRYLSPRHLTTLTILLTLTRNRPIAWGHTETLKAADAILIDIDSPDGRALLNILVSEKHQILIAHGERSVGLPADVLFLPKPLRSEVLFPILDQVSKLCLNLPTKAGDTSITYSSQLSNRPEATSKPQYLLDILVENSEKALGVTNLGNNTYSVIFEKKKRCYYYNEPINDIQGVLLATAGQYESIAEVSEAQLQEIKAYFRSADLDTPLWKAMLSISNGNLYPGLSASGLYKLRHWPDLKNLGFNIPHMKLATVLRRGGSISSLAGATQVPIAEVINFINTCYVLDYLEPAGIAPQATEVPSMRRMPEPPVPTQQKKLGLFSRIRSRLGI